MKSVIPILLCGTLSGCIMLPISHAHRISPAVEGRIVSEIGTPIIGARVKLKTTYVSGSQSYEMVTSDLGTFNLGPITEKADHYIVWLAPAGRLCTAIVEVEAVGYKPFKEEYGIFGPAGFGGCSKRPISVEVELEESI